MPEGMANAQESTRQFMLREVASSVMISPRIHRTDLSTNPLQTQSFESKTE